MFQADERLTSLSTITVSRYRDFMWFPPRVRGLDPTRTFGGEVSPKRGVGHRETQLSTGSLVFHLEVLTHFLMMMMMILMMMIMTMVTMIIILRAILLGAKC